MSRGLIIVLAILGVLVSCGFVSCGAVVGINNSLVKQEEGLKAQYKQNQNNYDNMWKKFKEVASVPAMYTEDLKKVYEGTVKSRYGAEGSKAAFQFIKEHNPQFDSSMYKQIQRVVEAGRNSFEANQKTLLDKKRLYETDLRTIPTSFIASFMGFPKINLADFDIVTSGETDDAFKTKKAGQIKLR
jgi:hypothetical protein